MYGAEPTSLQQAPGGRDNAVMVTKSYFHVLSLSAADGNYFLRPDRILGMFLLDPANSPSGYEEAREELELERARDRATKEALGAWQQRLAAEERAVDAALKAVRPHRSDVRASARLRAQGSLEAGPGIGVELQSPNPPTAGELSLDFNPTTSRVGYSNKKVVTQSNLNLQHVKSGKFSEQDKLSSPSIGILM